MLSRACLSIVGLFVLSGSLISAGQNSTFQIYGEGNASCGLWASARSNADNRNAAVLGAWLLGFISGAGSSMQPGALRPTNPQAIEGAMDKYCQANPASQVSDGARVLVRELAMKQ